MFSIRHICKENFHPFGYVMDDVTKHFDVCHGLAYDSIVSKLLRFDKVNDLHFRIQTHFDQISSTKQRKRKTFFFFSCTLQSQFWL